MAREEEEEGGGLIKSLETTKVFARDDPNASNLGAQCYGNNLGAQCYGNILGA